MPRAELPGLRPPVPSSPGRAQCSPTRLSRRRGQTCPRIATLHPGRPAVGTGQAGLRAGPPTWRTGSGIRNLQQLRTRRTAASRLILWPTET